jgi:2-polyprenyl-6-methoxyphenol hydroxylase-like FAD-dependent oxidoreductase
MNVPIAPKPCNLPTLSRAIEHLNVHIDEVNWFSTYRVHHRVAEHFRSGRAFLLGDAAHVHSPAAARA